MKIIKEFAELVREVGGYASHQTALFLLGQQKEMPNELTIVCHKRIANKVLLGKKVRVNFVSDVSGKRTEICKFAKFEIRVSTVEQTLVDMVGSHARDLSYLKLGEYFLTLIYDLKSLIEVSINEGDSYLKRILFYTAWTGRASWKDFPGVLQRIPINLFPKLKKDESYWCRKLFVRYPKEALKEFPNGNLPRLNKSVRKRIELARFAQFREYFSELKVLPIFDLPELSVQFSKFFREFLETIRDRPQPIFSQIAKAGDECPEIILEWIKKQARKNKLPPWFVAAANEWIRMNLESKKLENVIQAVELAIRLHLHSFILPDLNFINELFSEACRFDLIDNLCNLAWKKGDLKSLDQVIIYLSAQVMISKPLDALQIISVARTRFSKITPRQSAELSYCAAVAFQSIRKVEESFREIEACKEFYQKNLDCSESGLKLAGLELMAGRNFVFQGKLQKFRKSVLSAYRIAKSRKVGKSMVVATLTNLTQVEYVCGHFLTSIKFARQTLRKIPLLKSTNNRYLLIRILLAAHIGIGDWFRAMKYGKQLIRFGKKNGSESQIAIAQFLLAYLYELLGQPAAANRTWKIWDEDFIYEKFPNVFPSFVQVKVARLVFGNSLEEASLFLKKVTTIMSKPIEDPEPKPFLLHQFLNLGLILFKLKQPDALSVFENAGLIANGLEDCYEKNLFYLVMGALFPGFINNGEINRRLGNIIQEKAYDPFWFLYANELLKNDLPQNKQYLHYHVEKTHKTLLTHLQTQYPILRKIVKRFSQKSETEKVMLLESGNSRMISLKELNEWRSSRNLFFFDVVSGRWSFRDREGIIKPATKSHQIFSALLVVKRNVACISELYQSVWGGQFDPEIDKPAVSAALSRTKKILREISPAIQLTWSSENEAEMQVVLNIQMPWAVSL